MNELQKISQAKQWLSETKDLHEIKQIKDIAKAVLEYVKAKKLGNEAQDEAGELIIEAAIKFSEMKKLGQLNGEIMTRSDGGQPSSKMELGDLGVTNKESHINDTIADDVEDTNDIKSDLRKSNKRITENAVYTEKKKRQKARQRKESAIKGESIIITNKDIDFKYGDFVELSKTILDGSIDLILTDPPYPKEFIHVWSDLSKVAKRVLKPNGFLIAYSGQLNLSDVMNRLNEHLNYYWIANLRHIGGTQLIMHRNVMCGWKPLLIYQNGFKKTEAVFSDYFESEKQEKEGHDWQQSESVLSKIIDIFTEPGETIYEPFAGSGTTIVAAIKNKRKCIAHEIDKQIFNIAKSRVNDN